MSPPSPAPSANEDPGGRTLETWLQELVAGRVDVGEVVSMIKSGRLADEQVAIKGATIDLGRQERCGFGEVIYGEGKPATLIARIAKEQLNHGQDVLVTRLDTESMGEVRDQFPISVANPIAKTIRICSESVSAATPLTIDQAKEESHVAVVTAGSTDIPVAEEAMETLAWMGIPFQRFDDIGVAGPQRLLAAVPRLRLASAVIVIAGMEGALPSVVGGHLSAPIFAVPTSVGYGATLGGLTPLLGMLSSCASNVAVVNINAGFKGAYMAGLVVDQLRRQSV